MSRYKLKHVIDYHNLDCARKITEELKELNYCDYRSIASVSVG